MKKIIILMVINILIAVLWIASGYWRFSREDYIQQKVLDIARPLDVSIDIDFLKKLNPAYEQQ